MTVRSVVSLLVFLVNSTCLLADLTLPQLHHGHAMQLAIKSVRGHSVALAAQQNAPLLRMLRLRGGSSSTPIIGDNASTSRKSQQNRKRKGAGGVSDSESTIKHKNSNENGNIESGLDAEIEKIISNEDMFDVQGAVKEQSSGNGAFGAVGATPSRTKERTNLPRPNTMQIFREVSGSAIHFYDWPSANNSYFYSTDEDRTWRSLHVCVLISGSHAYKPRHVLCCFYGCIQTH